MGGMEIRLESPDHDPEKDRPYSDQLAERVWKGQIYSSDLSLSDIITLERFYPGLVDIVEED